MEIIKFKPSQEGIEQRSSIVPDDEAAQSVTEDPSVIYFCLEGEEEREAPEMMKIEKKEDKSQEGLYVSPVQIGRDSSLFTREVTLRLSNLSSEISSNMSLSSLLSKYSPEERPMRVNLVFDKETRLPKGVAYVSYVNKEAALSASKKLSKVVMNSLKLCVEILEN